MKTNAINTVSQMPKMLWQKVKRPAKIAAVALPIMAAAQSCGPLLFFPWFCPAPVVAPYCPPVVPMPVPVPVPIYAPPVPYYGPCCDTTSVETAKKKMDILG